MIAYFEILDGYELMKGREKIGFVNHNDFVEGIMKFQEDSENSPDDPILFRYFKNIKLHPSQYTIERISA